MGDETDRRCLFGGRVICRQVAGHGRDDVAPFVHLGVVTAKLLELLSQHARQVLLLFGRRARLRGLVGPRIDLDVAQESIE